MQNINPQNWGAPVMQRKNKQRKVDGGLFVLFFLPFETEVRHAYQARAP